MKTKYEKFRRVKSFLALITIAGIFTIASAAGLTVVSARNSLADGNFNVQVAGPSFAFSVGNGVNAYYAPDFNSYIYNYNGYYLRWLNGNWVYASNYPGPWYSLPPNFAVPSILLDGPPPPFFDYQPYFTWWVNSVGPWWHANYPGWWARHYSYMGNFNQWRDHVRTYYHGNPGGNWRMNNRQRENSRGNFKRERMPGQYNRQNVPAYRNYNNNNYYNRPRGQMAPGQTGPNRQFNMPRGQVYPQQQARPGFNNRNFNGRQGQPMMQRAVPNFNRQAPNNYQGKEQRRGRDNNNNSDRNNGGRGGR